MDRPGVLLAIFLRGVARRVASMRRIEACGAHGRLPLRHAEGRLVKEKEPAHHPKGAVQNEPYNSGWRLFSQCPFRVLKGVCYDSSGSVTQR